MAPRPVPGTIIILDVGANVSEEDNGKSFYQSARECVALIIERKIISAGQDLLGILLLGCKSSPRTDPHEIKFSNIEWLVKMQKPTWEIIRNLPKEPTKYKGDWLDAFMVAMDHAKKGVSGINISNMKIILITNFKEPTSMGDKKIKAILLGLQEQITYNVSVIGPEIDQENCKNSDLELARKIVDSTDGACETFEKTMRYLLFHKKKAPKTTFWNLDLCIGPRLKIPVCGCIRIEDVSLIGTWVKIVKDPVTSMPSTSETVVNSRKMQDTENESSTKTSELKEAYQFGEHLIPIDDRDKKLFYESGPKGLYLYGFTDANKIQWQNLSGVGIHYIFGRNGDKNAQNAIRCLVECLEIMKMVGVVRKVHYDGRAPKMYALMPVIDSNDYICLSLVPLCYKNEIKNIAFPQINMKKYACTDEQVQAFTDLIEAMDLTNAYDESFDDKEAFPVAQAVTPSIQYILDCIAFRAMNPDGPLPQPREDIAALLKVPPRLIEQSRKPLEKIKQMFNLKEVEVPIKKPRLRANDDLESTENVQPSSTNILQSDSKEFMPTVTLPSGIVGKVQKIGTVDPVGNFSAFLNQGKTLSELATEMTEVIENLIYFSFGNNYERALNAWTHFRKECVKDDPAHYNTWLQKFKGELKNRNKNDVLNIISEEKLDYILKRENSKSTFENELSHVESQMYENDTIPDHTEVKINDDVNDLFDEM